jgi:hypothetical protein
MNFGLIVRQALNKAILPWDATHLEMAKIDCNFIIQDLWYRVKADWRHSRGHIYSISGADEYLLSKHFDQFVKNTLQGPNTSPRTFSYKSPQEFFRLVNPRVSSSGISYMYTFGDMLGFDQQLNSASVINVFSSLANKTINNVNFISGSDIVSSDFSIFDLNDVGLRLKRDGDDLSYKIGKCLSSKKIQLLEPYRGETGNNITYKIGDIGTHANVTGFVGGEIDSEDIELDGENVKTSKKSFTTIVSLSKSDRTGGKIIFQNFDSSITVGVMAPGETEIERKSILIWPKPGLGEDIQYRFYMHHPYLWVDSDRVLIPKKWHRLVQYKLEMKIMAWAGVSVPPDLINDISRMEREFNNESEDMSLEDTGKDSDSQRNLNSYFYDHSESIG